MASKKSSSEIVSKRYACSLIDLAESKGKLADVEIDMSVISDILEESRDFIEFIASPIFSVDNQKKAIMAICKKYKFTDLTSNFLNAIIENGRLSFLPNFVEIFQREISSRKGEVKVGVKVANDLSAKQIKELEKSLSEAVGSKVIAEIEKDENIIGGMVVTVGSIMIDDSIRRKLDRLSRVMKTSNENEKEEVA